MKGLGGLLQSRRFVTFVVDAVLSLLLYFVGKYFSVAIDDLKFLILTLQPIAVAVIAAYTIDDNQQASLATQLQMHQATVQALAPVQGLATIK